MLAIAIGYLIFFLILFGFICYYAISKLTKINCKEISVIWDYYPQRYKLPSRFIRRQFKLEKKEILTFYYYQFIVSNIWLIMILVDLSIWIISGFRKNVFEFIIIFNSFIFLLNIIVLEIKTTMFQHKKKKQKYTRK